MKKRILGFPKNIFFLGLTSFLNDFSSEMVYSVFPAFFTSVLKSGAASLGIVEGVAEASANIIKIYSGNLSDRIQKRKPFVIFGYTLSTLTRPFYVLVSSVSGVAGLRFLDRVGKGMRDAPRDAIISLSVEEKDLGKSFGFHRAMDTLGAIFGPLVAFLILQYFPLRFDIVFISAFFIGIIAIASLSLVRDVSNHFKIGNSGIFKSFNDLSARFKFFLLSVFFLSAGSLPLAILLLKTENIGLAIASIPLFYTVYNVSFSSVSLLAGEISDHIGSRRSILLGYIFLIIGYLSLIVATTPFLLAISFLIIGLFSAFTDGNLRSLASKLSPVELRGEALGLISASVGVGSLIAGVAGGYLWQAFGFIVALSVSSIIVSIGLVVFSMTLIKKTG